MDVVFTRTGARRYAVSTVLATGQTRVLDPAPGFDEHIPHDLVHYLVEAELGLDSGVFGRAARGGGAFLPAQAPGENARERARALRRQKRREQSLHIADALGQHEMQLSEHLAAVSDLFWRRRHGQRPDSRPAPDTSLSSAHAEVVARVVDRLDELARLWHALPIGGAMAFTWPSSVPKTHSA